MRPNRWVILFSCAIGVVGMFSVATAFAQYLDVSRSFTSVQVEYVADSFIWDDEDRTDATAEFVIHNDSDRDVEIEYMQLNIAIDNEFAGARYGPWERVVIPARSEYEVSADITITTTSLSDHEDDAEISYRGFLRLNFRGIERPYQLRIGNAIGQVADVEVR